MVKKISAALRFFNLLDKDNKLSITNIAVVTLLIKLVIAPTVSMTEVASLLVVFLNYGHKRNSIGKNVNIDSLLAEHKQELDNKFADIESNVAAAMLKVGLK